MIKNNATLQSSNDNEVIGKFITRGMGLTEC